MSCPAVRGSSAAQRQAGRLFKPRAAAWRPDTATRRATLESAFAAVAACLALLTAQFGPKALGAELAAFVDVSGPSWLVPEMYLPQVTDADWTPVFYPGLA